MGFVYTNNVEVGEIDGQSGQYTVRTNASVEVVFQSEEGYFFEGKVTAVTNVITAIESVNEVEGPSVAYVTLGLQDPAEEAHTITFNYEWVTNVTGKADREEQADDLNVIQKDGNGYAKWQNLILGLDGASATAIPVCEFVQSQSTADQICLRLGGINVATESGATVTYKVWRGSAPGGHDRGASDEVGHTETMQEDLPPSGVLYYTLEALIR